MIALHRLVINQMGDVQKHLARVHTLARDLFGDRKEHAMHLDGECTGLGLALPLAAGALAQARKILLADRHVASRIARAGVVNKNLQMHLSLAAKPLDIGLEVALIGTDGATKRVVILKGGAKTEWQDGGKFEAVRNNAGMIFCSLLIQPIMVFTTMLGDDDG